MKEFLWFMSLLQQRNPKLEPKKFSLRNEVVDLYNFDLKLS